MLSNTYGHPNIGDEAILQAMLDTLFSNLPAVQISVLTSRKNFTALRYPRISAINSQTVSGIVDTYRVIKACDLLILGGGGIIQDATSFGNLLFHLSRPLMAIWLGKPFICYALGVGPLRIKLGRTLTRLVLNRANKIMVRDGDSFYLLQEIGINKNLISITADPALTLSPAPESQNGPHYKRLLSLKASGKPLIGISLRPFSEESRMLPDKSRYVKGSIFNTMVSVATDFANRYDAHLVFFSMHPEQDDQIGIDFVEQLNLPEQSTFIPGSLLPTQMLSIIAVTDLVIGMRLHALILAACSSIPVVALSYQPKVAGFMRQIGQEEYLIPPHNWHHAILLEKIESAWLGREKIYQEINLKLPELQMKANQNLNTVLSFLKESQ